MDLAEGQEAVLLRAVIDEGGLQVGSVATILAL